MKFTIGVLHYKYLQYGWINEPELKLSKSNKNKQNKSGLILVEGDVCKLHSVVGGAENRIQTLCFLLSLKKEREKKDLPVSEDIIERLC